MAIISVEQWQEIRTVWESDEREGFEWLFNTFDKIVTRQAISKRAKKECWTKVAQPQSDKTGRPTKYKDEYAEQARKLCLLGAIDKDLAEFFGIDECTVNRWKRKHPGFRQSIRRGKIMADAEVADALYKSAIGDVYIEEQKTVLVENRIEVVTVKKQIPPSFAAQSLWLRNRQPSKWRNQVEIKEEVDVNVFPPKEVLDAIYEKALAGAKERDAALIGRRERLLGISVEQDDIE